MLQLMVKLFGCVCGLKRSGSLRQACVLFSSADTLNFTLLPSVTVSWFYFPVLTMRLLNSNLILPSVRLLPAIPADLCYQVDPAQKKILGGGVCVDFLNLIFCSILNGNIGSILRPRYFIS